MSSDTNNKTSAPATWTAGSVMPSSENSDWPTRANPIKIPIITTQAVRAIRSRWFRVSLAVMARKAGTVAMGSTITKSELKASAAYSVGVMRLSQSGLAEEFGAWIRMFPAPQPFVECLILFGDRRRHHDVEHQEEIAMSAGRRREPLPFEPQLALGPASCRDFHAHRFRQGRRHDFRA